MRMYFHVIYFNKFDDVGIFCNTFVILSFSKYLNYVLSLKLELFETIKNN